jgi:uncharacterized protein YbjT (DUF2867 family)
MKIVVIGGTGLIGSKVVVTLRDRGHEAVAASPRSGVNAVTGEGLAEALKGAQVVVDLANSPTFDAEPAMAFFEAAGRNLAAAERSAGVKHHVALSVVGTDRLLQSGYFRAKMAQENLIKSSGIPYTIVRATQFFEFVGAIADYGTKSGVTRITSAGIQPIVSDDVADAVVDVALSPPVNGMIEIGGPERFRQDELVRQFFAERSDPREVITDDKADYFGLLLNDDSLVPGPGARLAPTRFADWIRRTAAAAPPHATVR